jgi:predicted flavoprotein YhiN
LAIEDPTLRDIDGRRSQAILTLKRDDTIVAVERGEVLFKKDALSGICIFNLSRVARARDTLNLDLLPDLSLDEARKYTHHTLSGVLDPVIANALIEREGSIDAALVRAKSWELNVRGLTDTNRAQVMRGGLILSDFSSATLEAKEHPGLFAAGEALDVDGPCGGFNLAWAWKSGMVAGKNAAAFASR